MHHVLNRDTRKWIYGVLLAAVPILVAYGAIEEATAPLWIALAGAIVAPTMALANLSPVDYGPVQELPAAEEADIADLSADGSA